MSRFGNRANFSSHATPPTTLVHASLDMRTYCTAVHHARRVEEGSVARPAVSTRSTKEGTGPRQVFPRRNETTEGLARDALATQGVLRIHPYIPLHS